MQDTPNSYLEVERRDPFLGIFGRGLGRSEEFAFANLCRFDSSWPPFAVGRARPKIVRPCNLHGCVVRFGSVRVVPGASLSKRVEIHCSCYIFRSLSVCRIRRLCSREAPCRCVMGSQVGDLEMSQQIQYLPTIPGLANIGWIKWMVTRCGIVDRGWTWNWSRHIVVKRHRIITEFQNSVIIRCRLTVMVET